MEKLNQILTLVFISIFLLSCNENKQELLKIIFDDFKHVNSSKNINIIISQDPKEKNYYFIVNANDDNSGFEKTYYTGNYKDYTVEILNMEGFDLELLGKVSLDINEPKIDYYNAVEIDDSDQRASYIYEVNDSIVEKRMTFDILGNLIDERPLNIKYR